MKKMSKSSLKRLQSNPLIVAQIMDLAQRKGWK